MTGPASREAERIARAAADAFNQGDADAFAALAHPAFVFRPILTNAQGGEPYRGVEGARQYIRDARAWATATLDLHEVADLDGAVVARAQLHIEANGRTASVPAVYIARLEDGLVLEVVTLADLPAAAAALALPEGPPATEDALAVSVEARPEHVPALRSAARAFASLHGVDEEAVALTVSEAATNAVLHAYLGATAAGRMELTGRRTADGIVMSVSDWGSGLRPRPDSPGLGLGLSLMQQLAAEVSFVGAPQRAAGTEVRLRFSRA